MIHLLLVIIYLSFISLGLPDSVLGSAWPTMYTQLQVPLAYAGIITIIISAGTTVSSLLSERLTKKFSTGKVTAISVAMTAIALFGFSISKSFVALCLWAIPYGLGAGSVDASLNNYVALHYESKHMSWLHCMWGLGAMTGPYIMGFVLTHGQSWSRGYQIISILQVVLSVILFMSLPLWNRKNMIVEESAQSPTSKPMSLKEIVQVPGAKAAMCCFFCYCAIEASTGFWTSSYLNLYKGISAEAAAGYASMFYIGITIGRALDGFIAMKLKDEQMIRMGFAIIFTGIVVMFLPLGTTISVIGFITIGLGCAPIFPCMIHATPTVFGAEKSQAIIGVQMASANIGICIMPPLFGYLTNIISIQWLPLYLIIILVVMVYMYERLNRKGKNHVS